MFPLSREPALLQGSYCLDLNSSCSLWMEHGPSTLLQASVTPPPHPPHPTLPTNHLNTQDKIIEHETAWDILLFIC